MVRLAEVKGSGWALCVGGFRGVSVGDVEGLLSRVGEAVSPQVFQLFDADRVAGWEHLRFAAVNALKAHESGAGVSRSIAIEVVLYASCQDQITRAFEMVGLSPSTERAALMVMARDPREAVEAYGRASVILGVEDDSVLAVDGEKFERLRGVFGVSEAELGAVGGARPGALTMLLVEMGALLPLRR